MKALPSTISSKVFGPDGVLSSSQSISSLTRELQRFFAKEAGMFDHMGMGQYLQIPFLGGWTSTRDMSEGVVGPQAAESA